MPECESLVNRVRHAPYSRGGPSLRGSREGVGSFLTRTLRRPSLNHRKLLAIATALGRRSSPSHQAQASAHVSWGTWAAVAGVLASLACVQQAAAAPAKPLPLSATVLAAPTVSKGKVTIPVLLEQRSERRVGASVVRLLFKSRAKLAIPGPNGRTRTKVPAASIRTGDWLRGKARLGQRARSRKRGSRNGRNTATPSLTALRFAIIRRESTYSLDELTQLVLGLARTVAELSERLDRLTADTRASISRLLAEIGDLKSRVDQLETGLGDLRGALEALDSALTARIDGLADDVTGLRSDLEALQTQVASLTTRLTSLEGAVEGLEDDLGALGSQVSALSGSMGALASRVDTLESGLADLTSRIDDVEGQLISLPGALSDISALESQVGALGTRLDDVESDLDATGTAFGELATRVDSLETTTTSLAANVAQGQTDISGLQGDVSNLQAGLDGVEGDVADLSTDVVGLRSDVTALQGNVGNLQGDVALLCGSLGLGC